MLKRESRGKYWIEIKNNLLFQKAVSQNNSIKKKEIHQKINVCNFKKIQQKERKQTKSAKIGYTVKLFSKHCGTQNWGLGLRTGPCCGSLLTPTASALNLRWIWVGRGPTMTLWAPYTPVFFPVWHQNWLSAMGNQSLSLWCDDQFLDSKNQLKKKPWQKNL